MADEIARFDDATAVTPVGGGRYSVELHPAYAIAGTKPNGGYLLATLGRAALDAAREAGATHVHVVSAGALFSASPDNGPADITTDVLRVGRSVTQVRARLTQGEPAGGIEARFTLRTLGEGSAPFWGEVPPVALAPLESCAVAAIPAGVRDTSVAFDPATAIEATSDGAMALGSGELRAWFVHADGVIDPTTLLYVADCLPPAMFGLVAPGWVPTLDLSAYVRAIPAPGPLRLRFRVQVIQDGLADEVLEAWDSEDRLVLQATQLAALRHPPNA